MLRGLLLLAVVLSVSATEEAAEPTEPEPVPAEGAAAEEPVPEEPEIVLNCNANGVLPRLQLASVTLPRHRPSCALAELLDKVETWSVDCVAQWLENLGFRAQHARTGRSLGSRAGRALLAAHSRACRTGACALVRVPCTVRTLLRAQVT